MNNQTGKVILRWIALVPATVIGALLFRGIWSLVNFGFLTPDNWLYYPGNLIADGIFGAVWVVISMYVAPKGKFITGIVMATSVIAIGIFVTFTTSLLNFPAETSLWFRILTLFAIGGGAILGLVLYSEDLKK